MNLPVGRTETAREVADTGVFLASPLAGYIGGAIVAVHGGAAHHND